MSNLKNIKSIEELLQVVRFKSHPVLINICPACKPSNFLMEEIVKRIISEHQTHIEYIKIDNSEAKTIMQDLKLTKTPIFLVVVKGEIMDAISGTIGYQLLNRIISKATKKGISKNRTIAN